MSFTQRLLHGGRLAAAAFFICGAHAPAMAQPPAIMRYNAVAESTYLLDRCGALTPARRAWLRKLADLAKQPLEWSKEQWAAHDAALAQDLARMYPSVPKVRCEELVRNINQEMKNPPAS